MALDDATLAQPSPLDTDEIPLVVVDSRPRSVWTQSWALGGVAAVLAVFQALSGLGLLFFYRPSVTTAFFDVVDLDQASRFGYLRDLHRWGSHAAVIVAALYVFRMVVLGSYMAPSREGRPLGRFHYQVGVVLGVVVLLLAATGYLLPWDVHAGWWIELLSEEAGVAVDDPALTAVYAFHCGVLPVAGVLVVLYHLRRRRAAASGALPSE